MTYVRRVSGLEVAWLVATRRFGPFVNQMVLELDRVPELSLWQDAVAMAGEANPGARVVLRGAVCTRRWVDTGTAPPVRTVDGRSWDGRSELGAPFLEGPLPLDRGPTTEVLLVEGEMPRVVVRTAHATMDGGGTIAFVEDVARALRGEALRGHSDLVTDVQLVREMPSSVGDRSNSEVVAATGCPRGRADAILWRRRTIRVRPRRLLDTLARATAEYARALQEGPVRIDVPVDLRRWGADVASTANLTGIVRVPGDALSSLSERLEAGEAAGFVAHVDFLRHLPLWMAEAVSRGGDRRIARTGRYGTTATLSNLGFLDPHRFSSPHGMVERVWFIPPGTPSTAAFVGISGGPGGVEIVVSIPSNLASGGRIDRFADALAGAVRSG